MDAPARDPLRDVRPGDRRLVAVAHPDDESFGCGSTIALAAARGADVTVVCATRGEAGKPGPDLPPGADLGTELRRAAGHLEVTRSELLGYRDSGFDGDLAPGAFCAAPETEVAAVLARLVEEIDAAVVVVLDGSDGHRDHLHVRAAMRRALDAATLGRDDADITHVLDTAAVLDRRKAAIAEHRSQTSPFDGLSDDLRRAFLATDHLAEVPPARDGR